MAMMKEIYIDRDNVRHREESIKKNLFQIFKKYVSNKRSREQINYFGSYLIIAVVILPSNSKQSFTIS